MNGFLHIWKKLIFAGGQKTLAIKLCIVPIQACYHVGGGTFTKTILHENLFEYAEQQYYVV